LIQVDERSKNDPKVRQFLATIGGGGMDDVAEKVGQIGGESERLFVPPEVWKIFDA
jgi:hypothetical protein